MKKLYSIIIASCLVLTSCASASKVSNYEMPPSILAPESIQGCLDTYNASTNPKVLSPEHPFASLDPNTNVIYGFNTADPNLTIVIQVVNNDDQPHFFSIGDLPFWIDNSLAELYNTVSPDELRTKCGSFVLNGHDNYKELDYKIIFTRSCE